MLLFFNVPYIDKQSIHLAFYKDTSMPLHTSDNANENRQLLPFVELDPPCFMMEFYDRSFLVLSIAMLFGIINLPAGNINP